MGPVHLYTHDLMHSMNRSTYAVTYNNFVSVLYLSMSIIISTPLHFLMGCLSGSGSTSASATASCTCTISVGPQDGRSASCVSHSGPCLQIDEACKVEMGYL